MSSESGRGGGFLRELLAHRGALPLVGAAGVVIAVIVLVAVVAGSGGGTASQKNGLSAGLAGTQAATVEATLDLNRPTTVATVSPDATRPGAAGDKFVVRKFGIEAPLTYKVVGRDGVMPNPDGPDDVAVYDFASWPGKGGLPGSGGNAIFSGHVDWGAQHGTGCKKGTVPPPCTAVFWDINQLRLGDEIEVVVAGRTLKYRVTSNQPVKAASADWDKIVSSTAQESITIITCGGDFNRETREYDSRQVVTAVRF